MTRALHWFVWQERALSLRALLGGGLAVFAIAAGANLLHGVYATTLDARQDALLLDDHLRILRPLVEGMLDGERAEEPQVASAAGLPQQAYLHVRVLDDQGRTLLETPGMGADLPAPSAAELRAWPLDETVRELRAAQGKPFLTLGARVAAGIDGAERRYLQIAIDRSEDHHLDRLRVVSWSVLIALVLAGAFLVFTIVRRGIRPLESIVRTIQRIHSKQLHERIETAGLPRELSDLASTFNDMLDRMESSFARISQFSDNVAHELRAPLNNLQSEIEVALRRTHSDDDYRDVLASCLEECDRITRIVQGLMFLAREGEGSPLHTEPLELRAELEAVREFYEALAAESGVALSVIAPAELSASLHRTLFRQAVGNLVANAITHTERGGQVCLRAERAGRGARIAVSDTGCGIAPQHVPYVFERFYRIDPERKSARRHIGLGLAIVKSIVARHGGKVDLESELGRGTTVTIALA